MTTAAPAAAGTIPALNDEQRAALTMIQAWHEGGEDPFFVLAGSAGTGKTFLMQQFLREHKGRVVFTAPTNKATKVLARTLKAADYTPECKTIYSLLGLQLAANGEVKVLAVPDEPVDLSRFSLVVVDEGSMINSQLTAIIRKAAADFKTPVLFLGDPAQLPPVGEVESPIWEIKNRAQLYRVMRHDNQILTLAQRLRERVEKPLGSIKIDSDNDGIEGVWRASQIDFECSIVEHAERGDFTRPDFCKVVAWRNATVDSYNALVRKAIWGSESLRPWLVDDRVIFTAPAKNLEDEIIATTDDEGTVIRAEEAWHPVWQEFKIWNVQVQIDGGQLVTARVLHPECRMVFERKAEEMAAAARADKRKWKSFWEFKEAFHGLRHGYAITAHRAQGSTYDTTFVDWRDVMLNKDRAEAFRCLYVACTRSRKRLVLN